jgi:phage terminase large subunit
MQEEGRISRIPIERAVPVYTAWDLGVSDSTAIWFIQCVGKERRLIDHYESSGVGLDHYARVLKEKDYIYAEHYFPHDVEARELTTGTGRSETLRGLGIEPETVKVGDVLDGINAVRRLLDSTWIDPERCARGLEALKSYRRDWDDKLKNWKAKARHDWSSHSADALRTFAMGFEGPRKPPLKTALRWFSRKNAASWLGA